MQQQTEVTISFVLLSSQIYMVATYLLTKRHCSNINNKTHTFLIVYLAYSIQHEM
jgi:hypothetical protein